MNPLGLVEAWLDRAIQRAEPLADSMCLATIADDGAPDSRMVRTRTFERRGLIFFTDCRSPKAAQIRANPLGSAVFFWPTLGQQIRVAGHLEELPTAFAEQDFRSKTESQQAAIICCRQSRQIRAYRSLLERFTQTSDAGLPIPARDRPAHWIGLLLAPRRIEFFDTRPKRLNRRLECVRQSSGRWIARSLEP